MAEILVLANETIGGEALLDAIRARHAQGDARFHVVVPQTRPRHGNVIYDEAVRDSAQVRVDLALAFMREEGIEGRGEVGDVAGQGLPFDVTLVVANQTVAGKELVDRLKALAEEGPRRFIIVIPQDSGDGRAAKAARDR